MIKIENTEVFGWEAAIRGMRNPMNSWDKSDSYWDFPEHPDRFVVGENDLKLMKNLSKAGDDHGKYLRMINVTVDITSPLYWYKEFDTYKIGTVANSCSTMHKIHAKEFTLEDFSTEHLYPVAIDNLKNTIKLLNECREIFVNYDRVRETNEYLTENMWFGVGDKKDYWWQMIQLLPSSYNQKRTIQLNYQVLKTIYHSRKNHKLDEWKAFCEWCEGLPYFTELCIEE